jgi:uncharacterized protein YbaP (TraB family)
MIAPLHRLTFLLAFLALFGVASAARAEPPVWVIRDKDSTIVLFGSVHILPQGQDWRPAALKTAIAKADDIWFEVAFDAQSRLTGAQSMAQRAMLPPGQSLLAMLSPADQERLKRIAATHGQPLAYYDRMAPWMADLALSQVDAASHGGETALGVEEVLDRDAPKSARRRSFETAEQQVSTLADASRADQLASLSDTLRSMEDDPGGFDKVVAEWMKGDIAGLITDALDPLKKAAPGMYERLIKRRNAAWVPMIVSRLAGSGDTVMVVGVGHLVGPDSVPAMLRARGITVEGP